MKIDTPKIEVQQNNKKSTTDYVNLLQSKLKTLSLKDDDTLLERGPTRNRDKFYNVDKNKPYSLQEVDDLINDKLESLSQKPSIKPIDVEVTKQALTLTPEQMLQIANGPDFKSFLQELLVSKEATHSVPTETRRLSNDSSYGSDYSSNPPTPDKICEPVSPLQERKIIETPKCVNMKSARELFRDCLKKDRKRTRWVEVNSLDEDEIFMVHNVGKSRLHQLLECPPPDLKEAFYANVEFMKTQSEEKFLKIVNIEPMIKDICEEKYPELTEYFNETIDCLR